MLLAHKNLEDGCVLKCPYCGQMHPITYRGITKDFISGNLAYCADAGYAFCNCKNIFFTDYENMNKKVYNFDYHAKYANMFKDNSAATSKIKKYADEYGPIIEGIVEGGDFIEIGCAHDAILDAFKERGWNVTGLDIIKREGEHRIINADFEKDDLSAIGTYDCVYASHVFEHFKDPIVELSRVRRILKDNGVLFVAMPDPYFINHTEPGLWAHWHIKEHYTLWDMDSFIDEALKAGYELVKSRRNGGIDFFTTGEYHIVLRKE